MFVTFKISHMTIEIFIFSNGDNIIFGHVSFSNEEFLSFTDDNADIKICETPFEMG